LRSTAAYRNLPGGAGEEELEHIGWDEWFGTFDEQGAGRRHPGAQG
jgi:hypothetical protein